MKNNTNIIDRIVEFFEADTGFSIACVVMQGAENDAVAETLSQEIIDNSVIDFGTFAPWEISFSVSDRDVTVDDYTFFPVLSKMEIIEAAEDSGAFAYGMA